MNERKQRLLSVVEVLASMVGTIQLRRTFNAVSPMPNLMWRVIYGNSTDMAVLEWCKLFASDDEQNQPVHWKNVAPDFAAVSKRPIFEIADIRVKMAVVLDGDEAISRSSCRASRSTAGGDQELSDIRLACIWCGVCGAVS